mgnify:CR=1 FL=1
MFEQKKIRVLADILGSFYRSGDEYLFHCPSCKHRKKYGDFKQRAKWTELSDRIDIKDFTEDLFEKKEDIAIEQKIDLPKEFITLATHKVAPASLPARAYLEARGITRADMIRWKMGYCQEGE